MIAYIGFPADSQGIFNPMLNSIVAMSRWPTHIKRASYSSPTMSEVGYTGCTLEHEPPRNCCVQVYSASINVKKKPAAIYLLIQYRYIHILINIDLNLDISITIIFIDHY